MPYDIEGLLFDPRKKYEDRGVEKEFGPFRKVFYQTHYDLYIANDARRKWVDSEKGYRVLRSWIVTRGDEVAKG